MGCAFEGRGAQLRITGNSPDVTSHGPIDAVALVLANAVGEVGVSGPCGMNLVQRG